MAETKTQSSGKPIQTKKKPSRAGAVFGSILFFILTVLLTLLLLGSAIGHHMLSKGQLSEAVSKVQLSEITVEENGPSQPLGQWVYEKYLYNSVNLTPEYAGLAVAQPEMNDLLAQYATEYSDYLTRKTETMPKVEADDFADLMQEKMASYMEHETGIIFSEADRIALVKNMQSDLSAWNGTMEQIMGHGFNKVMLRFFMTRAGMITACVLLNAEFVVWLIFAIGKKWRKGKMFKGFGFAVAIPSLLLLLGCGVFLLLTTAMDAISPLSFAQKSMPVLLLSAVWAGLAGTLYGAIFASIGIATNAVVRAKGEKTRKKAQPSEPAEKPAAEKPEFHYTELPEDSNQKPTPTHCPKCGAEIVPGGKFCGGCGYKF